MGNTKAIIEYAWDNASDFNKFGFGFGLGVFSILAILALIPTKNRD